MSICEAGQESFDADVHHQAAFDDGLHLALDQSVACENLRDLVPVLAIGGLLLRENDHAFVVFETLEEHFDFVADFERLDVVELRRRDHAFGLVTDVDENFARPDLENAPLDDAAFFEVAHRLRDQILHLQHKRWALPVRRGSVVKTAATIAICSRGKGKETSHVLGSRSTGTQNGI